MKLLVDVGNTTINIGFSRKNDLRETWRLHTNDSMTSDELFHHWSSVTGAPLEECEFVVASVVPELSRCLQDMVDTHVDQGAYFLAEPWESAKISIGTAHPDEVGADRVAGSVAMYKLFGGGIIVDFGTATTVDYVDEDGVYQGGVILPGLRAATKGLSDHTALLPSISPQKPDSFKFSNTKEALQSGLLYGTAGSISRVIEEFCSHGLSEDDPVVATGGAAEFFLDLCEEITDYAPNLVLEGLLDISKNR